MDILRLTVDLIYSCVLFVGSVLLTVLQKNKERQVVESKIRYDPRL